MSAAARPAMAITTRLRCMGLSFLEVSEGSADDVAGVAAGRLVPRATLRTSVGGELERAPLDVADIGEPRGSDPRSSGSCAGDAVQLASVVEVADQPGRGENRRERPLDANVERSVERG